MEAEAVGDTISLEAALQRVDSSGRHARRVLAASCAACFCGGMGGAISPFVLQPIAEDGGFTTAAVSMLAASTFTGMWNGSFVGGVACDALGPGRVMLMSLLCLGFAGVAPVFSTAMAISARTAVGFSLCATYQAANTYVAESVVTSRRSSYLSMLHVFIALGGLSTTLLAVGELRPIANANSGRDPERRPHPDAGRHGGVGELAHAPPRQLVANRRRRARHRALHHEQ